jgi:hypothetical protein
MEQWAILKTLSRSSPIFALSIHPTFSQTQAGATVPLRNSHVRSKIKEHFLQFLKSCVVCKTL